MNEYWKRRFLNDYKYRIKAAEHARNVYLAEQKIAEVAMKEFLQTTISILCPGAETPQKELAKSATEPFGTEMEVIRDIANRQQLGISKYGTTVSDNPLTLKEWLQHAYEECLDQAVYLKRAIEEISKTETKQ